VLGENVQRAADIPFNELPGGVYLARKPAQTLPVLKHYSVVVAGEPARHFGGDFFSPVVIEQVYPNMTVNWADQTGVWELVGKVPTELEPTAVERAFSSFGEPAYDLLENNCEQVARYITQGNKTSTQLWAAAGLAALVAIWLVNRTDN
jgi:hypothetical protein